MAAQLESTERGLELVTDEGRRLFLDFVGDRRHYAKPHRGSRELIARATGLAENRGEIWDLTAGLAEDAWFLVQLGARVRAFERHPLLAALLRDARERAALHPRTAEWASRLELVKADARAELSRLGDGQGPAVIYLDPMFSSPKAKSALPRKEMQIFRELVGPDSDSTELLREALRVAGRRVVVKRPLKDPPLLEGVTHRFEGSAIRFDFYQPEIHRGRRTP